MNKKSAKVQINGYCFLIVFIWATDTEISVKTVFGDQLMFFLSFLIWATDTETSLKNSVWGPVEWVGDQLTGGVESSQKQNFKRNVLCFFNFFDLSDRYWDISQKTVFGDQMNGLGTSWLGGESPPKSKIWKEMYFFLFERPTLRYLKKKKMNLVYFNYFDLNDRYRDICKKRCLGTSWMGSGPVDWVGRFLPKAKFQKRCTSFFEFFGFERPLLRYLLK